MKLRWVSRPKWSNEWDGFILVEVLQQWWEEEVGFGIGQLANRTKGEWRDIEIEEE